MNKRMWVLGWLLCITVAFGMYVHTAVAESVRPPAPGWSRPQVLTVMEGLSAYDLRNNEGIAVMVGPDRTQVIFQDPVRGLLQFSITPSGDVSGAEVLDPDFKPADKLQAYEEGGSRYLAALQDSVVNLYQIKGSSVSFYKQIPFTDVDKFHRYSGKTAAISDAGLYISQGETFTEGVWQAAKWIPGQESTLCTVAENQGRKLLQFWDVARQPMGLLAEWTLPADVQTAVETLTPYGDGSLVGAMVELKDFKTGKVRLNDYRLMPGPQEKEVISANGDLNPVSMGVEGGSLRLLLTQEQRKGDDESVWNIRQAEWNGKTFLPASFVTQTEATSIPIAGWRMDSYQYVLSADISGDTKKLMLSGNGPDLIERTAALTGSELAEFLPSVLMTLLPSLMVGLFPAVYIIVPVLLILFLITFFRLSWAERNFEALIRYAILAHILLKVFFAFRWVLLNENIPDIAAQLPWYLNSTGAMLVTLGISTAAAWITASIRNRERHQGDFWGPYGSFALIDLSIFVLLVMPYYYAYVGLPVFLR